jgi:hypothetical protein
MSAFTECVLFLLGQEGSHDFCSESFGSDSGMVYCWRLRYQLVVPAEVAADPIISSPLTCRSALNGLADPETLTVSLSPLTVPSIGTSPPSAPLNRPVTLAPLCCNVSSTEPPL